MYIRALGVYKEYYEYWVYIGVLVVYIGVLWVFIGVLGVYIRVLWLYIGVLEVYLKKY